MMSLQHGTNNSNSAEVLHSQTTRLASSPIVVKVGSQSLVSESGELKTGVFSSLAEQIGALARQNHPVILISSGAVSGGVLPRPLTDLTRQAKAAIGQSRIISKWQEVLHSVGLHAGQVLMTDVDIQERRGQLARVISVLCSAGAVPVLNANDVFIEAEGNAGKIVRDNDQLAIHIAELCGASRLYLLTEASGVLREGAVLDSIGVFDDLSFLPADGRSARGTGGILSKVQAAQYIARSGVDVVIGSARHARILVDEGYGTRISLRNEVFSQNLRAIAEALSG